MTVKKVFITYENEEEQIDIDSEFDSKLETFFKEMGLERTGSGYDLPSDVRDLVFEKTKKEEENV